MSYSLRRPLSQEGHRFVVRLERTVGSRPSPPTTTLQPRLPEPCPANPPPPSLPYGAKEGGGERQRRHLTAIAPDASAFCSALLDLTEFELHRRGTAKDRDRDLEAGARLVDLLDNAIEGRERTVGYADLLAYLEGNRRLR